MKEEQVVGGEGNPLAAVAAACSQTTSLYNCPDHLIHIILMELNIYLSIYLCRSYGIRHGVVPVFTGVVHFTRLSTAL